MEKVFSQIFRQIDRAEGRLESFLNCSSSDIQKLVSSTRLQCSEELLFSAVIGWIYYKKEERRIISPELLSSIDLRLFSQSAFESLQDDEDLQDLQQLFDFPAAVTAALAYRELSLEQKISWWRQPGNSETRSPRWPELVVVGGSGSTSGLLCCNLAKFSSGPAWRSLTKKPAELRRRSTGTAMVGCHPRLYFLGGEQNWRLHWYDLELNRWGVERGVPPARLLAGACVLGGRLYLVGGVTVEEWDGVRGGAGSINTSPSVDSYDISSQRWAPVDSLDLGRSSPGVAVSGDQIWVFGGLRRREVVSSCCKYSPLTDSWTDISDLPEKIAYFSLVTAGHQIWLLGGFGQDYTCRTATYCYDTLTDTFTQGPSLNTPRKGAFSFISDDCIFVCGGSVDGMKFLDSIEVMSLTSRDRWREQKLNMNHFNTNMVSVTTFLPVRFL